MLNFKKNKNINAGLFLLVAAYAYIVFVTLSYESAWMQPEIFRIKSFIVSWMHYEASAFWPLKYIFRFDVFECVPRSTRIFSSLFEIADTYFRVHLWKMITPHPSLSLTFIFTLLMSPYYLYKLLRNWEVADNHAKIAVAFYLVKPGTLSLVAMYFRPAKALAMFLLIFSFYWASEMRKRYRLHGNVSFVRWTILMIILIAGFLFDETAAIFFGAFVIVFYDLVFRSKKSFIAFASIPIIVASLYFVILPLMTGLLFSSSQPMTDYIGQTLGKCPLATLFLFVAHLDDNFAALFKESWGLFNPASAPSLLYKMFFWLQYIIITAGLLFFFHVIVRRIKDRSLGRREYGLFTQAVVVILLGGFAHGVLMSMVVNQIWGPYWYGSYMGVFFVFLLAGLYKIDHGRFRQMLSVAAASTMLISMLTFPYLNFAYKKLHYYPDRPLDISRIFRGEINRFEIERHSAPQEIKAAVREIVFASKKPPDELKIVKELLWLPIELGWYQKLLIGEKVFILDAEHYMLNIREDVIYDRQGTPHDKISFYRQTIEECSEAILKKPDYRAYYNRGTSYSMIGWYFRAVEDFSQAIFLKPDFAEAYNNRSVAYFYQGNTERGCIDAQKACELGLCESLQNARDKGFCP